MKFDLDLKTPRLLHHKSELGEFFLSSDAIGHSFKYVKKMSHIIDNISPNEIDSFYSILSTIGAYIIFPSRQIERRMTINAARGVNHKIQDRFDLTLECIRLFYLNKNNPLSDTFERYSSFFSLFQDFRGYVNFFLLQDLVDDQYLSVKFWHPFDSFDFSPLPKNIPEYQVYKKNVIEFVTARNKRML